MTKNTNNTAKRPTKQEMIDYIKANNDGVCVVGVKMDYPRIHVEYARVKALVEAQAQATVVDPVFTVTQSALNEAMAEVSESTMKIMTERFAVVEAELRKEITTLQQNLAEAQAPAAPVVVSAPESTLDRETVRAAYLELQKEFDAANDELNKAYRTRDKAKIEAARMVFNDKLAALKEMGKNMKTREHIADYIYGVADATRSGGHKAVDAVANALHKSVDVLANGIEATARMIDSKPEVKTTTPAIQ